MTLPEATNTNWDAIVIGAGPAGSVLACQLARQGFRVLLVDQTTFPRAKVCGGCLNGNAIHALKKLGLAELPGQLGGLPVQALHLKTQGRTARVALAGGVSISRYAFDMAMIDQCVQAGVTFLPHVRATMGDLEKDTRTVTLRNTTDNGVASARVVVLAHGLKAGTVAATSRMGAGVVLPETPDGYAPNTIHMAVGDGGYVGGVTVEGGQYDIAAAFDARYIQAKGSVGLAAVAVLQQAGFPKITDLENAPWKGTPMLTRQATQIAGERWFAVGDAAGYVEPFTGEGMAWAMTGALALTPIVAEGIAKWDGRESERWSRAYTQCVSRRQWPCRVISKVLRFSFLSRSLVQCLALCPVFARPFVHHLSRPSAPVRGVNQ